MKFNFDRNEALYDFLTTRFKWYIENGIARPASCDIPLRGGTDRIFVSNFENASGHVVHTVINVSLKFANFEKFKTYGLSDYLNTVYKGYVSPQNLNGYVFTLKVDLTLLQDNYKDLAHRIACIRRELFAPVINYFFTLQKNFDSLDPETSKFDVIEVIPDEIATIEAKSSEVLMTFALSYESPTEINISRMFLDEFSRETGHSPFIRIRKHQKLSNAHRDRHQFLKSKPNSNFVYFVVSFFPGRKQNLQKFALDLFVSFTTFIGSEIARIQTKLHQAMRDLTLKCAKRIRHARFEVHADSIPEASFYHEKMRF